MAEVIEVEIEQASEQEQRGREDERLVRLRLLKSSFNGDELHVPTILTETVARIIIEVLHRKINIQENSL
ncbi:unnamed protein product, partial [Porites lobata]